VNPSKINVDKSRTRLTLVWPEELALQPAGHPFDLTAEELRVWSPSAEVQGHGPGQAILQTGKKAVRISDVQPVGRYAIRIIFDDGHETGLYSWTYLAELCENKKQMWRDYLDAVAREGASRE
jgi:DUF971 family protein